MGIKKFTYRDIPVAVRARSATKANRKLQDVLSNPTASSVEQRELARKQQAVIGQWTAGALPEPTATSSDPSPEARAKAECGSRHTVVVDESLQVR